MDIIDQDLMGKVILEVGSGRGGTTRKLVDVLSVGEGLMIKPAVPHAGVGGAGLSSTWCCACPWRRTVR